MKDFKNSNMFDSNHGQGGGFHGPGGISNSNFQNSQGNPGGYNQQSGQGGQQQGGYQSHPKQLHKRAVNAVELAVLCYLRWSEQPILWSREDHPPQVDNPGHLALVVAP